MTISREQLSRHLPWLVLGFAVPLIALMMSVQKNDRVSFKGVSEHPLPQVCLSRRFLNVDCPGCGLTRSIIYLMHGNLAASYAIHRLGWLIFLMIIAQIPYRLWCLWTGQLKLQWSKRTDLLVWGTVVTLFILNMATRWFE